MMHYQSIWVVFHVLPPALVSAVTVHPFWSPFLVMQADFLDLHCVVERINFLAPFVSKVVRIPRQKSRTPGTELFFSMMRVSMEELMEEV